MSAPVEGSVFDSTWLALREPVDHASRAHGLSRLAAGALAARATPEVVDLGTGSGSNLRYLSAYLPGKTRWRLIDHDAALLARVAAHAGHALSPHVTTETRDLACELGPAIDGADLITASALLDLVSDAWLDTLCRGAAAQRSAVLFALSVDGRIRLTGRMDADDQALLSALALDQRRDKGLGTALGTAAPAHLINHLAARGYGVTAMPAIWYLDARRSDLAGALLDGWAAAAGAACPAEAHRFDAWAARRTADITAGRSGLEVGHIDVLGLPGRCRTA
ncbi:MAG: SAM-dependent methyltransferase [Xanthomonadales bacterium]|nr:SAM-dependent methyltransferase [Xanthomonadales bacterium]